MTDELQTDRFGLRFVSTSTEREYQVWRTETAVPFVQVGMVASLINWCMYLYIIHNASLSSFEQVWPVVAFVALPLLLIVLVLTTVRQSWPWIIPLTAFAGFVFGSIVIFQAHEVVSIEGEPENTPAVFVAVAALILMFFPFTIFRLPPVLASISVAPVFGLTIYFLIMDFGAGILSSAALTAFVGVQIIGFIDGLLLCVILEIITRRAYRNHCIIGTQQKGLERSQTVIRKYVPLGVAKRIIAGQEETIESPKRQRITVLFSDISGFTDIADRVEPEVMTEVLGSYMSAMADLIEQHGGTLNEFAGDGLMALFGAPDTMAPEDQARNAVQAAQAMQTKMPELNEQWRKLGLGAELKTRIGINTGMTSVGSYGSQGRMTYTAIGLQTNIASRIESAAEPGEILISDATYQLIHDDIDCEPKGEVECKGVHFPVKVYAPG